METGSVGIEKKISVFIQPTLESRKLVTKEEAKPRYYYLDRVKRQYSLVTIPDFWEGKEGKFFNMLSSGIRHIQ